MKTAKTPGPVSADLLLRLSAEGKTFFSIAEAQTIAGKNYASTVALLSQMVHRGWLVRLVPGKYLIVPLEAGLGSKKRTFEKLWTSRLAVQVADLPDLDKVLRVVRQHLRSAGLT